MSREFESYNVGRNLFLSKFCLECGLDDSLESIFQEISRSLGHLDIHIGSLDIADADNIDEFLFEKLNDTEVASLSLGVAVGMIQSVLLSLGSADDRTPKATHDQMKCTIDMALQRIQMVLDELGVPEIGEGLFKQVQSLSGDVNRLKASGAAVSSEIQAFEGRFKAHYENVLRTGDC